MMNNNKFLIKSKNKNINKKSDNNVLNSNSNKNIKCYIPYNYPEKNKTYSQWKFKDYRNTNYNSYNMSSFKSTKIFKSSNIKKLNNNYNTFNNTLRFKISSKNKNKPKKNYKNCYFKFN